MHYHVSMTTDKLPNIIIVLTMHAWVGCEGADVYGDLTPQQITRRPA